MSDYAKAIKKLIFEFNCEAHARELHRELGKLDVHFAAWRTGEMESGELAMHVHEFDRGSLRDVAMCIICTSLIE